MGKLASSYAQEQIWSQESNPIESTEVVGYKGISTPYSNFGGLALSVTANTFNDVVSNRFVVKSYNKGVLFDGPPIADGKVGRVELYAFDEAVFAAHDDVDIIHCVSSPHLTTGKTAFNESVDLGIEVCNDYPSENIGCDEVECRAHSCALIYEGFNLFNDSATPIVSDAGIPQVLSTGMWRLLVPNNSLSEPPEYAVVSTNNEGTIHFP